MYSWDGSSGHTLTNGLWCGSRAEIDTAHIGPGVGNIGTNAFNGCSSPSPACLTLPRLPHWGRVQWGGDGNRGLEC